jgi:hypothetical protein
MMHEGANDHWPPHAEHVGQRVRNEPAAIALQPGLNRRGQAREVRVQILGVLVNLPALGVLHPQRRQRGDDDTCVVFQVVLPDVQCLRQVHHADVAANLLGHCLAVRVLRVLQCLDGLLADRV